LQSHVGELSKEEQEKSYMMKIVTEVGSAVFSIPRQLAAAPVESLCNAFDSLQHLPFLASSPQTSSP
jgi:hypothetical protein